MRAWEHQVALTAQALASLVTRGPADVELDVALTARAAVLDHVATVLGDLVPGTRSERYSARGGAFPLARVEYDPIGALGLVLQGRGRPHLGRSPSELLDNRRDVDPATADWIEVGRRALIADRTWAGPVVGNLEPEAAWHALGGVASLAEAIVVLDVDLGAVAGKRRDVHNLVAATAGLRIAARETLALAAPTAIARPGPAAVAEESPPSVISPAAAIAARGSRASAIARDTRRLTILLDEAVELTPHHIRACTRVARNLCVLAAGNATSFTGADLRTELGAVAGALHAASRRDRGEFPLSPSPARALELQVRDLHASTKLAFATGATLDPAEATSIARRLPDLVEILADKTHAQIEHARWAVPNRSEGATLAYVPASCTEPELTPPMLPAIRQAGAAAAVLRNQVAHPAVGGAASPALSFAVATLRGVVAERGVVQAPVLARSRAVHPAQPPPRRPGTVISR